MYNEWKHIGSRVGGNGNVVPLWLDTEKGTYCMGYSCTDTPQNPALQQQRLEVVKVLATNVADFVIGRIIGNTQVGVINHKIYGEQGDL